MQLVSWPAPRLGDCLLSAIEPSQFPQPRLFRDSIVAWKTGNGRGYYYNAPGYRGNPAPACCSTKFFPLVTRGHLFRICFHFFRATGRPGARSVHRQIAHATMPVVHVLTPPDWGAFQDVPRHALYHELFSWVFPVGCCHPRFPLYGMIAIAGSWLEAAIDGRGSHCVRTVCVPWVTSCAGSLQPACDRVAYSATASRIRIRHGVKFGGLIVGASSPIERVADPSAKFNGLPICQALNACSTSCALPPPSKTPRVALSTTRPYFL